MTSYSAGREKIKAVIENFPVGEKVAPYTKGGKIITFIKRGNISGAAIANTYEFHTIKLMLHNDIPALFFDLSHSKPGSHDYFKAHYRVLYITKPLIATTPAGAIQCLLLPYMEHL